jgi:1-deoxy-D-xylulose-5-phosphate reductoisomerase
LKKVAILGSTGSIGTQALDVISKNKQLLSVAVLSCANNIEKLCSQIEEYHPEAVVVAKEVDAAELRRKYPSIEVFWGDDGLVQAATGDCDVVLNSLMGIRGLVPTYKAVMSGKDIALANKETLVAGGELIMKAVKEKNTLLTPVDSEHSAIFQCMQGQNRKDVARLILTGSGGPFRQCSKNELETVTVEQALKHPNWSMGEKITIDSSTLMNKGLEVIEAMWLFGFDIDSIDVVIHPQSIIHSMIEMNDGAILAQMGTADMRIPIAYALTYPDREVSGSQRLDLIKAAQLTFEEPDTDKFPCLKIAMDAAKAGGTYPVTMNGANEMLVSAFLEGRISYLDIPRIIDRIMQDHKVQYDLSLEVILEADKMARQAVLDIIGD